MDEIKVEKDTLLQSILYRQRSLSGTILDQVTELTNRLQGAMPTQDTASKPGTGPGYFGEMEMVNINLERVQAMLGKILSNLV